MDIWNFELLQSLLDVRTYRVASLLIGRLQNKLYNGFLQRLSTLNRKVPFPFETSESVKPDTHHNILEDQNYQVETGLKFELSVGRPFCLVTTNQS